MAESGETLVPQVPEQTLLPNMGVFEKIAQATEKRYKSIGGVVRLEGFPKEELDELYTRMTKLQEVGSNLARLKTAGSSDKLPDLEKRDIHREFKDALAEDNLSQAVNLMKYYEDEEYIGMHELSMINIRLAYADDYRWLEQVVALGEVMVETADQNPDARVIRQKIGQAAWEELLNAFAWKKLHYAAETGVEVTTEGSLEDQKAEFRVALQRKPWGVRETEKNRKIYNGIRKRIGRTEEGIEILKHLKIVWDCARGSMPEGISAVDILYSSETALQSLDEEGAFEWDPEELEEEGEEEEAEE